MEYRQVTKLKSTYADGLDEYIGVDGRIHSNFNQTITATGRISSTEPNLQNIPVRSEFTSKLRGLFIPSTEDGSIVAADYSQIELRVLAHISHDEHMIDAFRKVTSSACDIIYSGSLSNDEVRAIVGNTLPVEQSRQAYVDYSYDPMPYS